MKKAEEEAGYDETNPNHFRISLGDCFDREHDSLKIYEYYKRLCDADFNFKPLQDEIFYSTNVKDFENMVNKNNVTKVMSVASDGLSEILADQIDSFNETEFGVYMTYHLTRCEREELFGYSSHMLYICKKN